MRKEYFAVKKESKEKLDISKAKFEECEKDSRSKFSELEEVRQPFSLILSAGVPDILVSW